LWSGSLFAQRDCVLRKDVDSIKVFTCPVTESTFESIQASFPIAATLTQFAGTILNIDNYSRWQYNTIVSKILKRVDDYEIIYYCEVAAPWPVNNRDMIIHLKLMQDPESKIITITANGEPDYIPTQKELVRIPMSKSTWLIRPLSTGRLWVDYSIQIDPGGSVPAWMVNLVCAEAPYESFMNLRKETGVQNHKPLSLIKDF
jgi:hypothetical protein